NYEFTYVNGVLKIFGHPTNIILTQGILFENRPGGTAAGTLASESPDPNATYTYSLVSGTGSTDNALFAISGNNIVTAATLNFEQKSVYSVLVRSTTQYGFFLDKALTITISDVNEVPTLDVVANQVLCYSPGAKTISLSGITGGPETSQTATMTVTSSNLNLITQLAVTGTGTTRTIGYLPADSNGGTTTLTVTVRDNGGTANGGTDTFVRTFTVTINPLPVITLSSSQGTVISKGVSTQLTAFGGQTYTWANSAGIVSGQNTNVLTVRPAVSTTYTVTVTSAAGCVSTQSINLQVMEDYKALDGANILTPNGDGRNDFLVIKNIDFYPNNILKIFDTAGRLLHEKKGYANDWGGTYQGLPLAEGTYFYILDFGNRSNTQRGFVSIVY
ncbi:MAG: gliding motility-associated C-terminal domain-containing protein, partial [Phormidesmis sp. FL-bin-119]|nr:gliding motility-associated C-terminal domain-containing protein [Pedobacter sp.]